MNIQRAFGRFLRLRTSPILQSVFPRYLASRKDDSDSITSDQKDNDQPRDEQEKIIDVTEYYSQYIKEYEQGGFKDDPQTAEWEARLEKMNMRRGRGQTAVMDVEEIVEFLRSERTVDVCTFRMPKLLAYAPYMIIGTPKSRRHLNALTEKLLTAYKKKRAAYDPPSLRVEDKENTEWRAFDLGTVVVHLMMPATRKRYDIETLWAVGPDHDDLTNAVGELDEYSDRLKKLQEDIDWLSGADSPQDAAKTKA